MPRLYAAIAAGGVAGTLARYAVSVWLPASTQGIPRATLLVNLAGSALLGFALHHTMFEGDAAPAVRAAVAVGFCGAFTTMSTFALEVVRLGQARQWTLAATYVALTVAGSVAAVAAGLLAARRLTTLP
jgi:fluoride exporter